MYSVVSQYFSSGMPVPATAGRVTSSTHVRTGPRSSAFSRFNIGHSCGSCLNEKQDYSVGRTKDARSLITCTNAATHDKAFKGKLSCGGGGGIYVPFVSSRLPLVAVGMLLVFNARFDLNESLVLARVPNAIKSGISSSTNSSK
jgi:hypothetical protein